MMELRFAMPLVFREELAEGTCSERNMYTSWARRFGGKTVYLVGWCDGAFAVVDELGDYFFEFISGHPRDLFEPANDKVSGGGTPSA